MTTRRVFLAAGIAAFSISSGLALAQSPIQELKIMAPAGPGGGWDGAAELRWPGRGVGLRLKADAAFKHLMVYADPTQSFFCVEPQSNASGAFNRPGGFEDEAEGVIALAPEASAEATVRFEAFRL